MFKFLFARHRKYYIQLGWKYKMWPKRIYRLAHGSSPKNETEKKILHELLSLDIIHRRTDKKF